MAYSSIALSPLSTNGIGPKIWSYNTDDSAAIVKGGNYFLPAFGHLKVGDFIFFESGPGAASAMNCILVVTVCTGTTVTTVSKTTDA